MKRAWPCLGALVALTLGCSDPNDTGIETHVVPMVVVDVRVVTGTVTEGRSSGVAGAVVGGLLFGTPGAIIGGLSSHSEGMQSVGVVACQFIAETLDGNRWLFHAHPVNRCAMLRVGDSVSPRLSRWRQHGMRWDGWSPGEWLGTVAR